MLQKTRLNAFKFFMHLIENGDQPHRILNFFQKPGFGFVYDNLYETVWIRASVINVWNLQIISIFLCKSI